MRISLYSAAVSLLFAATASTALKTQLSSSAALTTDDLGSDDHEFSELFSSNEATDACD